MKHFCALRSRRQTSPWVLGRQVLAVPHRRGRRAAGTAGPRRDLRDAGGRVSMFTQAPAGFDNGTATNLWLPDGTPVFMTPRYLHYV